MTGNLLVASSTVSDPVYAHGVCLMVHQDDAVVIGVMLNRPMRPNPAALLEMFGETTTTNRLHQAAVEPSPMASLGTVHFGGPLSGPVVAIHQMSQYAEAETGQGIYVAAQRQHLEDLVRTQPCPYRLIVGHLGWETDKLQAELNEGKWHLLPATIDAVFSNADQMWPELIRRATTRSMLRWIGAPDVIVPSELN